MFRDDTIQNAINKGADQSARMRRLVCTCVVRKHLKTGFLATRPICHLPTLTTEQNRNEVTVWFLSVLADPQVSSSWNSAQSGSAGSSHRNVSLCILTHHRRYPEMSHDM